MNIKNEASLHKSKKGKRMILKIFGIMAAGVAVFLFIGAILHSTYFRTKKEDIQPYGQLVNVEDGKMHVYSMGSGEQTIVFLPGLGLSLPSADSSPLMRKLSTKYTVVCIEYFGMGFSTETSKPRTTENYVEEIREALKQAGFEPPYVLMPHSISGVYSEYYASKYPDEVKAIISLDSTSTAHYAEMPAFVKSILPVAKIQQVLGIPSILGPLIINKQDLLANGYTEKEIQDSLIFAGFTMNATTFEQIANSAEFIKETMEMPFPENIPYLKLISRQTFETSNPQLRQMNMTPQEYQYDHLARIGEQAEYKIINGNHFIYIQNADLIVELTNAFLLANSTNE
ncbi:alpha/beta hydrolase [Chloroflexota bacterium]|nr:alpha/beta hydrolase [Chloroflexota bacterium]